MLSPRWSESAMLLPVHLSGACHMPGASTDDIEPRIARLERQDERLTRALELLAERAAAPAGKPGRDWDALAAVIASFIGLLALAVSGYTAYVQREQLRAQVWPRLEIDYSSSDIDTATRTA